jgi:hypothetical protein
MLDQTIERQIVASRTIPVTELRGLLAAVSDHGMQHLVEVEADLMQTTFLLSEAIEKLASSFMAVHEAVMTQQQEIDALLAVHGLPEDATRKIIQYREKIGEEVNLAITGLQFQDLTSQLITRTIKRVNGLKDTLIALATHGDEMEPEHEHEEIAKLLTEMSKGLTTRSDALENGLRKSVDQKSMNSGEIELF